MLAVIEQIVSSAMLAANAAVLRVAKRRRRVDSSERSANGSGTVTESMTRSANSADGLISGSEESMPTTSCSAWVRSRHSGHRSRWDWASAESAPASQASRSSADRCGPGAGVISGPSYAGESGKVSSFQVGQQLPQLVAGAVDVGLHRTERKVQYLGDLLVGAALDVTQQDARPVFRPEPADSRLDRAAQLLRLDGVQRRLLPCADLQRRGLHRLGSLGVRRAVERERVQLPAPQMIDRGVVGDLEDPGRELELGTIGLDGVERLDEGLLGEILRQLTIPDHAKEEGEDRTLVSANQLAICRFLSAAGEQHDLLIAESRPLGTARHRSVALPRISPPDYIERLC